MSTAKNDAGKPYWFRAKRYGWGWSWPLTWQGWVALALFVILFVADIVLFPPRTQLVQFLAYALAISAVFIALCWLTGEPPRWRWGDEDKHDR
ncbi:MAG TPA: hypothetical protein VNH80_01680 [Burkholderiales bacterium]|nr:hypothetical protein [Burkholderiales bacterium]